MVTWRHGLVLVLLAGGCARLASTFSCDDSAACLQGSVQGTCEPTGFCSFDDASCPSGRRYGAYAPEASACVNEGSAAVDGAGSDGPRVDAGGARATDGLVVLYTFSSVVGGIAADTSGVAPALDLTVSPQVTLEGGALVFDSAQPAATSAPAGKVVSAVEASNEVTVEAWVIPEADTIETGVITGLIFDDTTRDVVLMENGGRYFESLRSSETVGAGGEASGYATPAGLVVSRPTHVVTTRTAAGLRTFWVDGLVVATLSQPGTLDPWSTYPIYVGKNFSSEDYEGTIELVAYYGRALTEDEIRGNFAAGPDFGD